MTNIEIISWRLTLNLYIIRMCFNIIIINIIITAITLKQQSINQPTNQPTNQSINQSTNQLVNPSTSQTNQNNQNNQNNQSNNQSINQPTNQPTHQQTNQSISRSVIHDIYIYIYTYHTEIPGRQQILTPFSEVPATTNSPSGVSWASPRPPSSHSLGSGKCRTDEPGTPRQRSSQCSSGFSRAATNKT